MFKKVIQSLLALLLLVQVLIPTTVFASETEEDRYDYGDVVESEDPEYEEAVEVEEELDFEINIEEDDAWTDAELAEWADLLEANTEVRDQSVYFFNATELNEEAVEFRTVHLELYAEAEALREEEIFELDFEVATEALGHNTEAFEGLVKRFEELIETNVDEVDEVEVPEVDVIVPEVEGEATPDAETVAPEIEVTPEAVTPLSGNVNLAFAGRGGTFTNAAGTQVTTVALNSVVTLNLRAPAPANGYVFSHWSVNNGGTLTFVRFADSNTRVANTTVTIETWNSVGTVTLTPNFEPRRRTTFPTMDISAEGVVNRNLNLRSGPGNQYHASPFLPRTGNASVRRGVTVVVRNDTANRGWSYVQTSDGRWGWLPSNRITRVEINGVIRNSGTRLRANSSASSRRLTTLSRNTQVRVLAFGGSGRIGWVQIRAGRRTGWVRSIEVYQFAQTRRTRRAITMRRGPGNSFARVTNIRRGRNVTVLGRRGSWIQVRYGRHVGWVQNNRTSNRNRTATLRRNSTLLHRGARVEGIRRGSTLLRGRSRVTILAQADHRGGSTFPRNSRRAAWTRIRVGNRTGWVLTSNLRNIRE